MLQIAVHLTCDVCDKTEIVYGVFGEELPAKWQPIEYDSWDTLIEDAENYALAGFTTLVVCPNCDPADMPE